MSNTICKIEEIDAEKAPAIYVADGLKPFIQLVKDEVSDQVVDLSTEKGRKEIASLAFKVSKSKSAVEKCGRDYLKKLKEQPKVVEKELRAFIAEMDALRDETRQPLTEWEEEQKRIKAEEEAKAEAEKMAAQRESDHEIAILLDEKYTREAEEAAAEKERQRLAYEQQLKDEAASKAEQEKIQAVEREIAAQARAALAEQQAKDQAKAAEAARVAAEEKAKQDAIDAAARAKQDEIDRQAREAAEIKAEQERRENNKRHIGKIRREAKEDLMKISIPEDIAKQIVLAISNNQIKNISINY